MAAALTETNFYKNLLITNVRGGTFVIEISHLNLRKLSKTVTQSALADMINHFLTEQADRLDVLRGSLLNLRPSLCHYFVYIICFSD